MTLAMVSYNPSPARTSTVARNDSADHSFYDASTPHLRHPAAALKPDHQNITAFPPETPLEKQTVSRQHDWFQLVQKKSGPGGWMGRRVQVEAGYGQICRAESNRGKNTMEWQQPSCAYLRAGFSF